MKTNLFAKVYCGTYAKYNNRDISGKWIDLLDYQNYDQFIKACKELHEDEADPELMFQDYECSDILKPYIGEAYVNKNIYDYIILIDQCGYDLEVIEACQYIYGFETIEELISYAEDNYQGQYPSDEDFARDFADELGLLDNDYKWPLHYIDWESAAYDLMMDYSESDGHYFRNS